MIHLITFGSGRCVSDINTWLIRIFYYYFLYYFQNTCIHCVIYSRYYLHFSQHLYDYDSKYILLE